MLSKEMEVAIVKRRMTLALTLGAVLGILASAPVLADPHGHVRFGVVIGGPFYPWWSPPYYYPPYYPYPPAEVTVPATPPTYIEKGEAQAPAQPPAYWYYCAASKTYYPYVKECPQGWQRVTPQPVPGG
jgi:hypothetical protein